MWFLLGAFLDLTDHRDKNVVVEWLLVAVAVALVKPNTGVVCECEKGLVSSALLLV